MKRKISSSLFVHLVTQALRSRDVPGCHPRLPCSTLEVASSWMVARNAVKQIGSSRGRIANYASWHSCFWLGSQQQSEKRRQPARSKELQANPGLVGGHERPRSPRQGGTLLRPDILPQSSSSSSSSLFSSSFSSSSASSRAPLTRVLSPSPFPLLLGVMALFNV